MKLVLYVDVSGLSDLASNSKIARWKKEVETSFADATVVALPSNYTHLEVLPWVI